MNVDKLIACVQSRNALWDQRSKEYHDRLLIKKLWVEVGQEMSTTVEAVKTKWRTMRDNFRKELIKMQGRSGTDVAKKPKWIYFETMSFLADTLSSRPSSGDMPMSRERSVVQSHDHTV
ncbi:uncharacterized protein LOC143192416 [Rhynchophorus ferrugineus]|uniref:uncharacterized protein LOC143192416 n=1 Tax=Rhynchophorus ferrugineus TaxID=354439 RepID=UPI003FCECD41